jgi:glycosyltransferase involved in cell wall biosynthesis
MLLKHRPRADGRLGVKFVITSMPVGGAETLLANLIRNMDQRAFAPEVVCLKQADVLGEALAGEVPVYANFLTSKWDVSVLPRLAYLFRHTGTDAVITVGAGDKMFWGRLAAKMAAVPVICSALHSTGWPDGVGRLNRCLTPLTDAFIAVAQSHAEYLAAQEGFPPSRVFMIPNGVDTNRFRPNHVVRNSLREELGIADEAPVISIIAALRPEKNHVQFVEAARSILQVQPLAKFLIVGDGPERTAITQRIEQLGLQAQFHLLGSRNDTERILAGTDLFCLTSRNEANPVSILEALATCLPVVAPDVGSIKETVIPGKTGLLTQPLNSDATAEAILQLLGNASLAARMGRTGRQLVQDKWSLQAMVQGYETLLEDLYNAKAEVAGKALWHRPSQDFSPLEEEHSELRALVLQ